MAQGEGDKARGLSGEVLSEALGKCGGPLSTAGSAQAIFATVTHPSELRAILTDLERQPRTAVHEAFDTSVGATRAAQGRVDVLAADGPAGVAKALLSVRGGLTVKLARAEPWMIDNRRGGWGLCF